MDDLEDENTKTDGYYLSDNFPNPFNPGTTISYSIAEQENVTIEIYNITGELINRIVNEIHQPGYYEIFWNGKDNHNHEVGSGVYIYRIHAGQFLFSKKMILLK